MLVKDLYYKKYLKYKNKYLNLQSQIGGRFTLSEYMPSSKLSIIKLPIEKISMISMAREIQEFVYFKNLELLSNTSKIEQTKDSTFFKDDPEYNITVIYSSDYNPLNNSRNFTVKFRVENKINTQSESEFDSDDDDFDETEPDLYSRGDMLNKMEESTCNIEKFSDTTTTIPIDNSFYKITFKGTRTDEYILSSNHELLQKYVELKKTIIVDVTAVK
jgi:hypothetical protein